MATILREIMTLWSSVYITISYCARDLCLSRPIESYQVFIPSHGLNIMVSKRKRVYSIREAAKKTIKTIEDLDNYQQVEECLAVSIPKEKTELFAKAGLFRNLLKGAPQNSSDLNNPNIIKYTVKKWDDLPLDLRDVLQTDALEFTKADHVIRYTDLTTEEAFKLVVDNEENGVMVAFETIGHIAHLNIPIERDSIKGLIAKIIMDKHKHIKTVINKKSELQNEFRTMDIEHLAGEKLYKTRLVENGYKFDVDFENVYWNSRLIQERVRITELLCVDDIIVDMFAGVGPFAIYGAKKGCLVFANDLNPVGAKYIEQNAVLNKVEDKVKGYNKDARVFVEDVVKNGNVLNKNTGNYHGFKFNSNSKVHFIMNLPKIAIEFLDVFKGLCVGIEEELIREVIVHCYCFSPPETYKEEIDSRIQEVLKCKLEDYTITKGRVRTKTVKRAARQIVEKYYGKLGLDFQYNKKVAQEVALIPSKRMRNKVAGFVTHLMRRIQRGPVRGISLKLQEDERERRMEYVPDKSEIDVPIIQIDQDTADMLNFLKINIPNIKVMSTNPHDHRDRH